MESPLLLAVTVPEPAVVPVNVTEQVVPVEPVDNVQLFALSEPPVVPGFSVKVTDPLGVFVEAVRSETIASIVRVQLLPPRGILQVPPVTSVLVISVGLVVTVTVTVGLVLKL